MNNALTGLTENAGVAADNDFLGGFSCLESDVYDFNIEHAYVTQSAGGATAVNFSFIGANNAKLRTTIYVSSGAAKGSKNTYEKKNKEGKMETHYLPGFNQVNALCYMTAGQPLAALASTCEKKTLMLYDFDKKGEVATEVDMIMGLVKQNITAAVLKQVVDKKSKNSSFDPNAPVSATNQAYLPTGETREENEVDKFFRTSDKLTFVEISKGVTESVFMTSWLKKWKGKDKDKTSKTGIVAGAPGATGAPSQPAAAAPLFANQAQ